MTRPEHKSLRVGTIPPGSYAPARDLPRVAVIGGGFSGACIAIHLLRQVEQPIEIAIIEPRPALGHGLAYGTGDTAHRINVPSDKMSVFAEDPLHFTRWLERTGERAADPEGEAPPGWHFSRRQVFGAYMAETLDDVIATAPRGSRVLHVRDRAIGVAPAQPGVAVRLEHGGSLEAERGVLVVSHERPIFRFAIDADTQCHPGLIHDPWDHAALAAIKPHGKVIILGTGLTMADVTSGLLARGHRGRIVAISRRGQLPQPHGPFDPVIDVLKECGHPRSALAALRLARDLARREVAAGRDWHLAIDGFRLTAESIWRSWPIEEQQRALVRLRAFWDTHRYRIAPQVHHRLSQGRLTGQLDVCSGRIKGLAKEGEHLKVTLQAGGDADRSVSGDVVINCMGPSPDITRSANPILRDLLDRGIARPDPHRLGFDVDDSFRLRDAHGKTAPELRAVGPLTRGVFWEVIGVPELSNHCRRLSEQLANELAKRQALAAPLAG